METRNKLLYPMLLVAAFSVTAFSMVGIATMTGKLPSAQADVMEAAPPALPRYGVDDKSSPAPRAGTEPAAARLTGEAPMKRAANDAPPAARHAPPPPCNVCGVVESIRTVERKGAGTGVGAVAGGLTGAVVGSQLGGGNGRTALAVLGGVGGAFAGNEIEKNVKKSTAFQVKVRMDDGTVHVTTLGQQPDLAVGDKVRIDNGNLIRRG